MRLGVCAAALAAISAALTGRVYAAALTPESPEVRQAVSRALEYLATENHMQLGGKALIGLAAYKATGNSQHPLVQKHVQDVVGQINSTKTALKQHDNYSMGIGLIFLSNLKPEGYQELIDLLLTELLSRQKEHGGWGYEGKATGDTSMTQYAVLGMWEAGRAGRAAPVEAWEQVANWLLRTQDPSGGFGYQARDPGSSSLVPQPEVRHSLSAGGLASIYLCADYLGIVQQAESTSTSDLPAALRRVEVKEESGKTANKTPRRTDKIDVRRMAEALAMGERWFNANWGVDGRQDYFHYYLYALERYETFREVFGGPPQSQDWYDEGASHLLKTQGPKGSWTGRTGPLTDTAFAVLFLVRSTRKGLGPTLFGGGSMIGGRGIPKAEGPLQLRGGDIVASPAKVSAEQLLSMMEDVDDPVSIQAAEAFYQAAERQDEEVLNKHAEQLKKLAGSELPEARVAAVKAMARRRNLDDVPTLLYCLTDPDTRVVGATVDALRYISRQPHGSPGTVITDAASRDTALAYWKRWYRDIRPDADLSGVDP